MREIDLRFNAGVEYNGKIYASAININGLFQLDLSTHEVTYIKRFMKESPCYAMHRTAFLYGTEVWFIPQEGKYIAIVDLVTLDIEYLEPPFKKINEDAVARVGAVYYSGGIIGDKYLYLIPANIDTLLLIELESRKLYPYYDVPIAKEFYLYGTYADGCIYLFPYVGNDFIVINLKTGKKERYPWKYACLEFGEVVYYNDKLWFCPACADYILSMDPNTKAVEEIPLREFYNSNCEYEQIQIYKDALLFLPFQANKILEFHVDEKKLSQKEINAEWLENGANKFKKIGSKDHIILASRCKSMILIYDDTLNEFQKIDLKIERNALLYQIEHNQNQENIEFEDYFHKDLYVPNGCYNENFWGIDQYIESIFRHDILAKDNRQKYGKLIWKEMN